MKFGSESLHRGSNRRGAWPGTQHVVASAICRLGMMETVPGTAAACRLRFKAGYAQKLRLQSCRLDTAMAVEMASVYPYGVDIGLLLSRYPQS